MPYDSLFAVVVMAAVVVIVAAGIFSRVNKQKKMDKEEEFLQDTEGADSDVYYENSDPDYTADPVDFSEDGDIDDGDDN